MRKLALILLTAVVLSPAALAQSNTPSHPLSHIHPIDTDFNMSGKEIYNVSKLRMKDGLIIDGNSIQDSGRTDILVWNDSYNKWEVKNGNLSMNGNQIQDFFASACPAGEVVHQIYANGSYECQSITDATDDKYVNEAGDTMNGSLNMSWNNISHVDYFKDFFDSACAGADDVIKQVYDNGSYQCVSVSTLNGVEDLQETLDEGNWTGGIDINMSNSELLDYFQSSACSGGKVIDRIYGNGTYHCVDPNEDVQVENLSETLTAGNYANQSIEMGDNLRLGGNIINETHVLKFNGATGSKSSLWLPQESNAELWVNDPDGTGVIMRWNDDGTTDVQGGDLNLSGNTIKSIGGLGSDTNYLGVLDNIYMSNNDNIENIGEVYADRLLAKGGAGVDVRDDGSANAYGTIDIFNGSSQSKRGLVIGGGDIGNKRIDLNIDHADTLRIYGGNINVSDNNITDIGNLKDFFASACGANQVVDGINSDGSYQCVSIDSQITDKWVNESGDTMTGDLNLSGNQLVNPGNITDFFSNACSGPNEVVKRVYENGSYQCDTIPEDTGVENLASTLNSGNYTDGHDIVVNGTSVLDLSSNNINNIGGLYSDSGSTSFFSGTFPASETISGINADGTITTQSILIGTSNIQDGAVTNVKIASSAVNTTQIVDSTITASDISSNTITASEVAGDTLTASEIAANAIGNSELASNAVASGNIQSGAVTNVKISDAAVNRTQIAQSGCSSDEVLQWDGSNWVCTTTDDMGTDDQNLSEVLVNGNIANQTILMRDTLRIGGNNINETNNLHFNGASDSSSALVLPGESNAVLQVWDDDGTGTIMRWNDDGSTDIRGDLNLSDNTLRQVGNIVDKSGQDCGDDQYLDGNGNCQDDDNTDSDADSTNELQNLSEVLTVGNKANQSIDMDGSSIDNIGSGLTNITSAGKIDAGADIDANNNNIDDVASVDGGGNAVRIDDNLDMNGNSVTDNSGSEMCIGDQCT